MRKYDAIVVGAGCGGLGAATALQKNGVKTLLLEKHNTAGGAAESFVRGRFEFEASLHILSNLGTKENPGVLRELFDTLGITDQIEWLELENYASLIIPGKINLSLPANRKKLEAKLSAVFPEEAEGIKTVFEVIYGVMEEYHKMLDNNFDLVNPLEKLDENATKEKYPYFYKYAYMPLPAFFAQTVKNPYLIGALCTMLTYSGPLEQSTVIDLAIWTYYYIEYKPFHVRGCSFSYSSALVEAFRKLGGEPQFNTAVVKLLTEDDKVVGVVTEQGEEIYADQVICNFAPMIAYKQMLEPSFVPASVLKEDHGYTFHGAPSQMYLGLDCTPEEIGITDTNNFIFLPEGRLTLTCHDLGDPHHKEEGKCTVTLLVSDSGYNWVNVPVEDYYQAKYKVGEKMLRWAEMAYPGISEHIEEMEISTSVTNARFMGAPSGTIAGQLVLHRDYVLGAMDHNKIPGLTFVGAWNNNPGGMQPAMFNGWGTGNHLVKEYFSKK